MNKQKNWSQKKKKKEDDYVLKNDRLDRFSACKNLTCWSVNKIVWSPNFKLSGGWIRKYDELENILAKIQ